MSDSTRPPADRNVAIPPDDLARQLSVVDPDDPALKHVAVVGDTYTILLSGADTSGHFCLIDMLIAPGGGPGPHRHDFEEMFTLLNGELDFTFRGKMQTIKAGMTVNIPANAPHFFKNSKSENARMLCLCSPSGQEEFFLAIGSPLESRTAKAPKLSESEQAEFIKKAAALAPNYRTELLKP